MQEENRHSLAFAYGLNQIQAAADFVINQSGSEKIWCFNGQMGSGKTTLIKSICKQMGVSDEVNSPTFALVNEYLLNEDAKIYHFDFYRINSVDELYDIGIEEYLDSGNICLIEWPELAQEILSHYTVYNITIQHHNSERKLLVQTI